jgi:hypothetical protein
MILILSGVAGRWFGFGVLAVAGRPAAEKMFPDVQMLP